MVLVYTFLICGVMLTGKVNSFSSIPTASYLILPLAPLAHGLIWRRSDGILSLKGIAWAAGLAIAVCVCAMGLALAAEFGSG